MITTSPGFIKQFGKMLRAAFEPIECRISVSGSSSTPNTAFMYPAAAFLKSGPPLSAYPRFAGFFAAAYSASTTSGNAMSSGSPTPMSMSSTSGLAALAARLALLIFSNLYIAVLFP